MYEEEFRHRVHPIVPLRQREAEDTLYSSVSRSVGQLELTEESSAQLPLTHTGAMPSQLPSVPTMRGLPSLPPTSRQMAQRARRSLEKVSKLMTIS